jgi:hypothetical protein
VAAGLTRGILAVFLTAALLAGCAPGAAPAQSQAVAATPQTGVTPAIDAARAAVAGAVQTGGFSLTEATGYQPGEAPSLQAVPRVVYQLSLAGPNEGWVVIYDVGTPDAALAAGSDFATYLQKSGHSNYPSDAAFTLNVVGSALIFHWFSQSRSPDADQASKAFDLVSSVGQQIEVIK